LTSRAPAGSCLKTEVIVVTTVWVDYLRGVSTAQTTWLDREAGRESLAITDLILCEVLQGTPDRRAFDLTREQLMTLAVLSAGGADVAVAAASHCRTLRERGRTVRKTIDCLIATFCLMQGHTLLHNDRDFDVFEP
jgi:predicted nucleic acid-binding protein